MPLATGKKWDPALAEAKTDLRHQDIVGQVQHGGGGLGLGATTPTWQKFTLYGFSHPERLVNEVRGPRATKSHGAICVT